MKQFWNGEGGEKWLRFQDTMDANLLPFGQKAMAAAAILSGEWVLDIGCGCGDTSLEMARLVGPDGRVSGVDISKPILARAKARAQSVLEKNITFERGDAQVLRFEAAAFDLVFSRFGVMFFDETDAAFKNLRVTLKPADALPLSVGNRSWTMSGSEPPLRLSRVTYRSGSGADIIRQSREGEPNFNGLGLFEHCNHQIRHVVHRSQQS